MKNQNESLEADAKYKMLFNSDNFEFLVKFITVLLKITSSLLFIILNIVLALLRSSSSKKNEDNHTITHFKEDGSGYNSDGDRII